ncbi:conserved membrane hypothetical protein [Hyella patelloides LEGE 07179]|uniref:Uncharacterized protein n=1 Tax=Hyella patelloides LEGE 07179 TaxID=945734 RepID=A0A563W032_9CYAN|nr:lysylphosphatidylglycerol synthase transmembrane domain-containing protein [Hyella patelloides]VEP17039.1 conserved membrane hypothetical protein [Hyella patelloides LEGE 07179]
MPSQKKIIFSILSLALGFVLLWLTLRFTEVEFTEIIASFYNLNPWYTALAIASLILHFWFTAYKWNLVTHKLTPERQQSQGFYFFYTTLGALSMQFMPQYIGMVAVQNLALRLHKISSFSRGFLSVIYDQFFNFLIPVLLFPASVLFVLGYIPLSIAVFATTTVVIGTHFIIKKWYKSLIQLLIKGYFLIKKNKSQEQSESEAITTEYSLFGKKFTIYLFWVSVTRYLFWLIRGVVIAVAGGFKIKLWAIVFITPIVQLAMLLSFTPANLGLMELSWLGLLRLFQVPTADAIEFAFLQRFLYIISAAIALLGFFLIWLCERFFKLKPVKNK